MSNIATNVSSSSVTHGSDKLGYTMYFSIPHSGHSDNIVTFPIAPEEINIKVGSKNETVTLINGGEINIPKSPSLVEIEFDARFPMRKYPYSRQPMEFIWYAARFGELKTERQPFRFIVTRTTPSGKRTWDTNLKVLLEDYEIQESADEGDDVIISFQLKQYTDYGVKKLPSEKPTTTSTSEQTRSNDGKTSKSSEYTIKSGDCLWNIAKAAYGDATKWTVIYEANKTAIEADAKKHGKQSSSNGHWIWAGLKITIPPVGNASK